MPGVLNRILGLSHVGMADNTIGAGSAGAAAYVAVVPQVSTESGTPQLAAPVVRPRRCRRIAAGLQKKRIYSLWAPNAVARAHGPLTDRSHSVNSINTNVKTPSLSFSLS